ncbi:Fic family protein [Candidatus Woesearchaeota archaeon]|nr:Fic family protein [Candidatus Woesearchaeota archaeon]
MKVDKSILREIDRKLGYIKEKEGSAYFNLAFNRRRQFLRALANFHSSAIEHPVESSLSLKKGRRSHEARKIKEAAKVIQSAWLASMSYTDIFNPDMVKAMNYMIQNNTPNPPKNKLGAFRQARVTLGLNFTPPNYVKIPELMDSLYRRIQTQYEGAAHPIEASIEAHFGIATIQPFGDGNKRTARLYQARILDSKALPIPYIPVGERLFYLKLLEEAGYAASVHKDRASTEETNFANYLASRVNVSLEFILGRK